METILISQDVIKPIHIVFNNDKSHPTYHPQIIKILTKIFKNYEGKEGNLIVDYCENAFASIYAKCVGFKTLYINGNYKYGNILEAFKRINSISDFNRIHTWRDVNGLIKTKKVILQISDKPQHILNSKRLIGNERLDNILIILKDKIIDLDELEESIAYLHINKYSFYHITKEGMTPFDKRRDIDITNSIAILCIHRNSLFRSDYVIYFD
tara:strand:- start:2 stop:634 length:633 start_codon:yes stop_codon:yes gene_type:complete